jgi:hypothetical protein
MLAYLSSIGIGLLVWRHISVSFEEGPVPRMTHWNARRDRIHRSPSALCLGTILASGDVGDTRAVQCKPSQRSKLSLGPPV